jgi:hypothetical protein
VRCRRLSLATLRLMTPTGLSPWERLLLVAALVVGVLTMHATPVLCPHDPGGAHLPAASTHERAATVVTDHDDDEHCGTHHALAACLAILGVGLLLVALRLLRRVQGPATTRARAVQAVCAAASRAPPRPTTDRLAELCVSRR